VHYYAMQFIDGQTLAEVISELGKNVASGLRPGRSSPPNVASGLRPGRSVAPPWATSNADDAAPARSTSDADSAAARLPDSPPNVASGPAPEVASGLSPNTVRDSELLHNTLTHPALAPETILVFIMPHGSRQQKTCPDRSVGDARATAGRSAVDPHAR
jgi:hypothetical protein